MEIQWAKIKKQRTNGCTAIVTTIAYQDVLYKPIVTKTM